jgi:hypothetical protein
MSNKQPVIADWQPGESHSLRLTNERSFRAAEKRLHFALRQSEEGWFDAKEWYDLESSCETTGNPAS